MNIAQLLHVLIALLCSHALYIPMHFVLFIFIHKSILNKNVCAVHFPPKPSAPPSSRRRNSIGSSSSQWLPAQKYTLWHIYYIQYIHLRIMCDGFAVSLFYTVHNTNTPAHISNVGPIHHHPPSNRCCFLFDIQSVRLDNLMRTVALTLSLSPTRCEIKYDTRFLARRT